MPVFNLLNSHCTPCQQRGHYLRIISCENFDPTVAWFRVLSGLFSIHFQFLTFGLSNIMKQPVFFNHLLLERKYDQSHKQCLRGLFHNLFTSIATQFIPLLLIFSIADLVKDIVSFLYCSNVCNWQFTPVCHNRDHFFVDFSIHTDFATFC